MRIKHARMSVEGIPIDQLDGGIFRVEFQRVRADALGALDLEARLSGLFIVDERAGAFELLDLFLG